jgi:YD repeat-containing protein
MERFLNERKFIKVIIHLRIYFVRNLQGDVMKLTTATGETVAAYNYDAWGKVVSVLSAAGTDVTSDLTHIGNINPIRYRSCQCLFRFV